MNEIIRNLTIQNYRNFKYSFENTKEVFWDKKEKKLIHPGEYGAYREELAKTWLRMYVPQKFGIGSGFVICSNNSVSTQCDVIIYDKTTTATIENVDNQKFYPIETVSCIGEIKSDINSIEELNKHLIKLSEMKKFRESVKDSNPYFRGCKSPFSPTQNPFDNIFTFLICNKFNFEIKPENINYGSIEQRFKHNLVLSLNDGILNYKTHSDATKNLAFSFSGEEKHSDNYLKNDDSELPTPVISFLSSLRSALNLNALLSIDMTLYLTDNYVEKIE